MTTDGGCAICGASLAGAAPEARRPVSVIRAFAAAHSLDEAALCPACACGAVPSPCVSLCTLDDDKACCRGCGRSVEEIETWAGMSTAERCAVRLRLRARRP